jgi:hypothetical protein
MENCWRKKNLNKFLLDRKLSEKLCGICWIIFRAFRAFECFLIHQILDCSWLFWSSSGFSIFHHESFGWASFWNFLFLILFLDSQNLKKLRRKIKENLN